MTIARKDIEVSQGETTALFFKYVDSYGNGIDLTGNKAILAIKRYPTSNKLMLLVTDTSVVHGGDSGEFINAGFAGTGNSVVNQDTDGNTVTGGMSFFVDSDSMSFIPSGRQFYQISLVDENGGIVVDRVFEGRGRCSSTIHRNFRRNWFDCIHWFDWSSGISRTPRTNRRRRIFGGNWSTRISRIYRLSG